MYESNRTRFAKPLTKPRDKSYVTRSDVCRMALQLSTSVHHVSTYHTCRGHPSFALVLLHRLMFRTSNLPDTLFSRLTENLQTWRIPFQKNFSRSIRQQTNTSDKFVLWRVKYWLYFTTLFYCRKFLVSYFHLIEEITWI